MADLPDVPSLAVLEPPPGGLARLRATLDRPRRSWWLVAPAVVALAAIALWLGLRTTTPPPATRAQPDIYWVSSQPAPRAMPRPVVVVPIDRAPQVSYRQLP